MNFFDSSMLIRAIDSAACICHAESSRALPCRVQRCDITVVALWPDKWQQPVFTRRKEIEHQLATLLGQFLDTFNM